MLIEPRTAKEALLHRFPTLRMLVIGDLMLDEYLWGSAVRMSPEAPVPLVKLTNRTFALGGAANVALNLANLGVQSDLAGMVGDDLPGAKLLELCEASQIGAKAVLRVADYRTTVKSRVMADDRQLLRYDDETVEEQASANIATMLERVEVSDYDAVIISDYAKGACTPEMCKRLISECRNAGIPVYVDPKGRDYDKYRGATAIKPNRQEMAEISDAYGWNSSPVEAGMKLRGRLDLRFVALTLGAKGIAIIQQSGTDEIPTVAREVFDVSGAGDTVMATMAAGLAAELDLQDSVRLANLAAAEVVAHTGTVPIRREDLLLAVQALDKSHGSRKYYSLDELLVLTEAWRRQGLTVAFTNGCFDLLHAGHVQLLEQSSIHADRLIIGLNSDASIRRLKGDTRPIMGLEQRAGVLSALECIDAVVVFEEDTPRALIEALKPDVLIKGGDYTEESIVGSEFVKANGGRVEIIPLVKGISSSILADAISKL